MKPVAPGTVIFHRYRGYGVVTSVNLLTGWISARFASEGRTLDLNLSCDHVQHADGLAVVVADLVYLIHQLFAGRGGVVKGVFGFLFDEIIAAPFREAAAKRVLIQAAAARGSFLPVSVVSVRGGGMGVTVQFCTSGWWRLG